jgi:hypothetical protein
MNDQAKTEVAPVEPKRQEITLNADNPRERELMLVQQEFALQQRQAQALASSNIIPKDFQANVPNCMIALEMSNRLKTGALEIMQNLYVVHGRPAFSSAYLIAKINTSNILRGRLRFNFVGEPGADDYGCYAAGTCRETGEELRGTLITMKMAREEGWSTKNGSKWKTMPDQMLQYRAAAFWSRINAPDATMGMHTTDEAEDMREINPAPKSAGVSSLGEAIKGRIKEKPVTVDAEKDEPAQQSVEQEIIADDEPTAAYLKLLKGIEIADDERSLDAIINMPDWSKLAKGEGQKLQAEIAAKREALSAAQQAQGLFGQAQQEGADNGR